MYNNKIVLASGIWKVKSSFQVRVKYHQVIYLVFWIP